MTNTKPKVSIGLPVYNAEKYLWLAFESLLAQDYGNIEVIVSDNGSTDATAEVCFRYAAKDNRIQYYRNDTNVGAAKNFNRVFKLSSGKYFMWAAHDDVWDPSYISKGVAMLEAYPPAVLCCSTIKFIDENGGDRNYPFTDMSTPGMNVQQRIHVLLNSNHCCYIYGVMRREALQKTRLVTDMYGPDVVLLLEMLLLGEFIKVPEVLFYYRLPWNVKNLQEHMTIINPLKAVPATPYSDLARELLRVVNRTNLSEKIKFQILADFVESMSFYNLGWRGALLSENLNTLEPFVDPQQMRNFILSVLLKS